MPTNATCSAPDCTVRILAKGLCSAHYHRLTRYGDFARRQGGKPARPLEERFWSMVKKSDGCWEWQANTDGRYGLISRPGQRVQLKAHRVSWEMAYGPIPDGMLVCHRCDNPPCVRPDHLFLGTSLDNSWDMVGKGRASRGAKLGNALTPELVRLIRATPEITNRAWGIKARVSPSTISRIRHRLMWGDV